MVVDSKLVLRQVCLLKDGCKARHTNKMWRDHR